MDKILFGFFIGTSFTLLFIGNLLRWYIYYIENKYRNKYLKNKK